VLESDRLQREAFEAADYGESERTLILQRELVGFRPPIDRTVVQLRRELNLDVSPDPLPSTWWQACSLSLIDRTHFVLRPRGGGPPWGTAHFWDIEPLASTWGVHAMGLLDLQISDQPDRAQQANLISFLLGESIRQLLSCGVTLVEVQVKPTDTALHDVCQKLGFHEVHQGIHFQKRV
jgi:hypothetical protein